MRRDSVTQTTVVHDQRRSQESSPSIDTTTDAVQKAAPQPIKPKGSTLKLPNYLQKHSKSFRLEGLSHWPVAVD